MHRTVASQVSRDQAWRRLHARWYGAARKCWRYLVSSPRAGHGPTEHLELVELALYLVTFQFAVRSVSVLVDGFEGHAALADLRRVRWGEQRGALEFSPRVSATEAIEAAREVLNRARSAPRARPIGDEVAEPTVEIIAHPYWAYYFERLSGKLDAKLLDAATGKLAGPRIKAALLRALAGTPAAGSSRPNEP